MSTYPINTTGQQFHFDVDGTSAQLLNWVRSFNSFPSVTYLTQITNWAANADWHPGNGIILNLLFPQPRDLEHFSFSSAHFSALCPEIWLSYDTTDGLNGTWSRVRTNAEMGKWSVATTTMMRIDLEPFSYAAVKGLEFRPLSTSSGTHILNFNLFGSYTPIGLQFWHATEDRAMDGNNLDIGDIMRNGTYTREFRIKNQNTLTANDVLIAAVTPNSGSTLAGIEFSTGGAYAVNQTITTIVPSAISSVITVRRTVASNATENQLGNCRITATEGSWS